MEEEKLEPIIVLSQQCKIIAFISGMILQYSSIIIFLTTFYLYDWFIAFFSTLFGYLLSGIIRSKIRVTIIEPFELEKNYTDYELLKRYISKFFC